MICIDKDCRSVSVDIRVFRSRLECNLRCLRAHGEAFDERCLCRCWRFGEREITFGSRCGHERGLDGFLLHLFRWGGRSNSQAN